MQLQKQTHMSPPGLLSTIGCRCTLLCNQQVAIVARGKCGVCAPSQRGGFPYCTASDVQGLAPVCGVDSVTYRNALAAKQAGVSIQSGGACDKMCGEAVSQQCSSQRSWEQRVVQPVGAMAKQQLHIT